MKYGDQRGGYPFEPGWKERDTSEAAARGIEPKAGTLKFLILDLLRSPMLAGHGMTPEQIARFFDVPVHNIRPRCSELSTVGLIEDSGGRGPAMGGRRAIRWRATNVQSR